jgi:hypothetical protein
MSKLKTFLNGGTLLPGDLNNMEEDYEGAFGFKKHLLAASTRLDAPGAGTFLLGAASTGAGVAATGATAALSAFYLNPADYEESSVNKRTVKLNVQATFLTNAVAPAVSFTVGLYPVTGVAGAENAVSVTLGSVVSGSTAVATTPPKELGQEFSSGLFTCPTAGFYALAVLVSGTAAAKSSTAVRANLQMAQI